MIRVLNNIYKDNINQVIRQNQTSTAFTTKEGLRQGGGLSPALFTVFIDDIIKKCRSRVKKYNVGCI